MTLEEWNKLSPHIKSALLNNGLAPKGLEKISAEGQPYTNFGVVNSPEYKTSLPSDLSGFTVLPKNETTSDRSSLRVYDRNEQNPKEIAITRAHETEHALASQGRGGGYKLNAMWDEMVGEEGARRGEIVRRLIKHAPYLTEKWGLPTRHAREGYFSKDILPRPDSHNFLYEQMATLSGLEQLSKKRFVEDPYVRKHILKTPAERETYEAMTGLRQTRLDAKDLPPYTRQKGSTDPKPEESDTGFMGKIKSMLGMYQGGLIRNK